MIKRCSWINILNFNNLDETIIWDPQKLSYSDVLPSHYYVLISVSFTLFSSIFPGAYETAWGTSDV